MYKPLLLVLLNLFFGLDLMGQTEHAADWQADSTRVPVGALSIPLNLRATLPAYTQQAVEGPWFGLPATGAQSLDAFPVISGQSLAAWPTLPGLGDIKNYGGELGQWQYKHRFAIDYGAFISRQSGYSFASTELGLAANARFTYQLSNRLQFLVWAQYFQALNGAGGDPVLQLPFLFNQSKVGSALQFTPDEKSNLQIGVEYEYDPVDKKWKAETGGRVQLKF